MRYTVAGGAQKQWSDRFNSNLRYVLPLMLILAGTLYFGLHQNNNNHKVQKPLTLGIYTIKTPDKTSPDSKPSDSNNNDSSSSTGGSILTPQSTIPSSSIAMASPASASSITGIAPGGSGSGGSIQSGGTTTVTSTTTSCIDSLTKTTLVCAFPYQTCTIPLTGVTGVKTVDGTCITIN
jgi:hypothetical protein